jgi:renalase
MNDTIAVIGAGISGLMLAQKLRAAGERVVVLEKSRGYGGRMATKRVGEASFDQGAQYFTVREASFAHEVEGWREAGVVANWPDSPHRRLVGRPAMTAVPKALAEGLEIKRECKVTTTRRLDSGGWELDLEGQATMRVERLVFACPVPQALALLKAGEVNLPEPVNGALAVLTYHACLAVLYVLAGPSAVPAEGMVVTQGPVRWLADNVKKGIAQNVAAAVTVHLSPEFSAEHYAKSEGEVAALVTPLVERLLGAPVVSATLHRWKFSEPTVTHAERCVWIPELGLGFVGDAFGGPKVEGAALSGLALAERLQRETKRT